MRHLKDTSLKRQLSYKTRVPTVYQGKFPLTEKELTGVYIYIFKFPPPLSTL